LTGARLNNASISGTNFSNANLCRASLNQARLVNSNFAGVNLRSCSIYGISVSSLNLEGANQLDLIISNENEPTVMVDSFEVAQFIYLILQNHNIRHIIDSITSKVVLILGQFSPERQAVLAAIRDELRNHDFLPVSFDFREFEDRDWTETISTLAYPARFIIADLTRAAILPQELNRILPALPPVPVQLLRTSSFQTDTAAEHLKQQPWVLDEYQYNNAEDVRLVLADRVITSVRSTVNEFTK
jgi:hypothetical protein